MADINFEDFEENSDGQLTPQEKALGNLLIRDKIVSLLDFYTLQSCRLVSTSWCKWASCGILEKDCCQVRLTPATIGDKLGMLTSGQIRGQAPCSDFFFLSLCGSKWKDQDIDKFISVLGHQIKSLTFGQGKGSVVTSDLIRRVLFPLLLSSRDTLRKLVLKDNFICFNCDFIMDQDENQNQNGEQNGGQLGFLPDLRLTFDLPALQLLCLSSPDSSRPFQMTCRQSLACKIIDMAPNLKRVENLWIRNLLSVSDFDPDFWTRNAKLVKSLDFQALLVPLEDLQIFTAAQPQLETLSISPLKNSQNDEEDSDSDAEVELEVERAHEQLYKILESSAKTLRTLRIKRDTEDNSGLRWLSPFSRIPRLPNLENLELKLNCDMNLNFYFDETHLRTSESHLQNMLPSLKKVSLVLNMRHYWGHFRPFSFFTGNDHVVFSNNLKSVHTLQLSGAVNERQGRGTTTRNIDWLIHFPSGWLQRVKDLFPSVRTINIRDTSELDEMLPEFLRLWPHLEILQVDVKPDRTAHVKGDTLSDYLNSVLSGVPVLQWKIMRENRRIQKDKIEELILQPNEEEENGEELTPISFCYLSRLKSIKIHILIGDGQWIQHLENCPISSRVLRHLLCLNPNLKIFIHFNRKAPHSQQFYNFLEPLAPFVEILHEKEQNPFVNS